MEQLLDRLRNIQHRARRNQDEIENLIKDVERLNTTTARQDDLRNMPGSWPDDGVEITPREPIPAESQHHLPQHEEIITALPFETLPRSATPRRSSSAADISSEHHHVLSVSQRPNRADSTENDALIAALLTAEAENDSDQGLSEVEGSTNAPDPDVSHYSDDPEAEDRLETAMAIAIVDSLDTIAEAMAAVSQTAVTDTTDTPWLTPLQDIATATAETRLTEPSCPICTASLSTDPEDNDDGDEESDTAVDPPVRVFCPACTHPFHAFCLSRWFQEDRDPKVCPHCRTEMEADFIEEVLES
jgi:hypothetical protein